jgi:hypothetical protein
VVVLPEPLWPTAATIKTVILRSPPSRKARFYNKVPQIFDISNRFYSDSEIQLLTLLGLGYLFFK